MGRSYSAVLSVLSFIFVVAGAAHAQVQIMQVPGITPTLDCVRSYRADSYGRGLEAGFTGTALAPQFKDSLCYALGVKVGHQIRSARCSADFNEGLRAGRVLGAVEIGSPCYNAGYQAGRATFRVGAREQDARLASAACLTTYRSAYEQGYRRRGNAVPSTDRVLAECYREGYSDGEWFQIESRDFFGL